MQPNVHFRSLWITWHSTLKRWQVRIKLHGQAHFVGTFHERVNAYVARNTHLHQHEGGLARAWVERRRGWKGRSKRAVALAEAPEPPLPLAVAPAEALKDHADEEDRSVSDVLNAIEQEMKKGPL